MATISSHLQPAACCGCWFGGAAEKTQRLKGCKVGEEGNIVEINSDDEDGNGGGPALKEVPFMEPPGFPTALDGSKGSFFATP